MTDNEKYLITGASGFIGSEVVAKLLENVPPEQIILLGRKKPDSQSSLLALRLKEHGFENLFSRLTFVETDFENAEIFKKSLSEIPVEAKNFKIVHMAAYIHAPGSKKALQTRINIGVTRDLLDFSAQKKAKHFVFLSSIVAFGGAPGPALRSEIDFFNFPSVSNGFSYYTTKREAHELLIHESRALPLSILCPGVVHGSLEHFKDSRGHLKSLRKGSLRFAPSGGSNFVGLDRVAASVAMSVLGAPPEGVNTQLLVDQNLKYQEFFQLYTDLARQDLAKKIHRLPPVVGKLCLVCAKVLRTLRLPVPMLMDALVQGSLYLYFKSEQPLPPTKGLKLSLQDSLKN